MIPGKIFLRGNALVSGKPRTPIPGECEALVGDFGGFGLSLLPRYAGFSTAFGQVSASWDLERGSDGDLFFDANLKRRAKITGKAYGLSQVKIHSFHVCNALS